MRAQSENYYRSYPKISVVTPSYNQGAYLEATILSVLDQNYPNLEYIIIDGGSTDNSVEIIKKYESKLAYWISEKDAGMFDAIQKGFDRSTGEIMAWINSDDLYHPNAFFAAAELFTTFQQVEWLTGVMTIYNEKGNIVEVSQSRVFSRFLYWSGDYKWIQQESTFFKRTLWGKAGGYIGKGIEYAGDFELWLRFFNNAKLYKCNVLFGGFRIRQSNQRSLERINEYTGEINVILSQHKMSLSTRFRIFLISVYNILFKLFQKKSLLLKLYFILIDAPEIIYFDRHSQTFKLGDYTHH